MSRDRTSEIIDSQVNGQDGRSADHARRRIPSSLRGSVDDIAASEDILRSLSCVNHYR